MVERPNLSEDTSENLVIVGSGPAGYTAAIYAARANLKPVLITGFLSGGIPGGQLMTTTHVENFPGFPNGVRGPELMDLIKEQALRWGTQLIEADAEHIDLSQFPYLVVGDGFSIRAKALIIATGASAKKLGIPNEDRFWSKGISACAICDGATPYFLNEELAVVGGGDSACEEAIYLTKYGSHIHLFVRSGQLKASAAMIDRVRANPSITLHWNLEVVDANGNDWLESVVVRNRATNNQEVFNVRGLFYAIGHRPNTQLLVGQIKLDEKGYLFTKYGRPETDIEGVFAAGDVSDSEWRQGITAAASGCKAALAAERWLSKNNFSVPIKRDVVQPPESKCNNQDKDEVTTKDSYQSDAFWQKGSYALRRLYHESNKALLVIYTSSDCGPCYILKPQLRKLLDELKGEVQVVEIDIELDQKIAKQADVNGTPTVQLFKDKKLYRVWKGVKQRSEFKEAIKQLAAK